MTSINTTKPGRAGKTKSHTNFFETIKEARMRLNHTVVMYDGEPCFVLGISNHKADGIFRIYLDPLNVEGGPSYVKTPGIPFNWMDEGPGATIGDKMDAWLETETGKNSHVMRKMMNSPHFNRFRPFPLGNVNRDGDVIYMERTPVRNMQQGLESKMLMCAYPTDFSRSDNRLKGGRGIYNLYDPALVKMYLNEYPSFDKCITSLKDRNCLNLGAAFHRYFALVRGPLDTMFLAYKGDVVGVLPKRDKTLLEIDKKFAHTKEACEELKVFYETKVV